MRGAVALLDALDYPEYNLYAISYGTTVALELLRYYDEHPDLALPALRTPVIDGAYPTYVDPFEHALMFPDAILDVFAACEADGACAEAYPDIRQRAIDFLAALDETPIQVDEDTEIKVVERPPAGGDLFDPIAAEVTGLAAQARQLVTQIESIGEHSRQISAALGQGASPAALFTEEFVSSSEKLPHFEAASIYISAENLTFQAPTLETIEQLAGLAPEEEQAFLQSIINLMEEDDILQSFTLLRQPSYLGRLQRTNEITNWVVECNDRYANFDLPATFETLRAYDAPQLILDPTSSLSYQIDCEGYGLTADPAPLPDPVTSSVRTLVSNGALDVNTRVAWGGVVFDALTNAEMVTFPNSGHAATMLSQCAKDITNFFITYPEEELNLDCIEDMKPVFVLPGAKSP